MVSGSVKVPCVINGVPGILLAVLTYADGGMITYADGGVITEPHWLYYDFWWLQGSQRAWHERGCWSMAS